MSSLSFSAITAALSTKGPADIRAALISLNMMSACATPSGKAAKTFTVAGYVSTSRLDDFSQLYCRPLLTQSSPLFSLTADELEYDSDDETMGTPSSVFSAVLDASSQTSVASDLDEWEKTSSYFDCEDDEPVFLPSRGLPLTTANSRFGPSGNFFNIELSPVDDEADTSDYENENIDEAPRCTEASELEEQNAYDSDGYDIEIVDDELPDWRLSCELRLLPLTAPITECSKTGLSTLTPFLTRDTSGLLVPSAARLPETKLAVHCGPGTNEWTTTTSDHGERSSHPVQERSNSLGFDVESNANKSPASLLFLGVQNTNSIRSEVDNTPSTPLSSTSLSDSLSNILDAYSETLVSNPEETIIARALQSISSKSTGHDDVLDRDPFYIRSCVQLTKGNSRLSSIWHRLRPKQMPSASKANVTRGLTVARMGLLLPDID